MKVLLIAPPDNKNVEPFLSNPIKPTPAFSGYTFPMGLSYLSAYIKKEGHTVNLLDCLSLDLSLQDIRKIILKTKPDVIGITSMTHYIKTAVAIAGISKTLFPKVPVVCGGPHANFDYENLLNNYSFDYVVVGEGEKTFSELLKYLKNKNSIDINNIQGIAYKKGNKIIKTPPRPFIKNLDEVPFPARELLDFNNYIYNQLLPNAVEILGSRGCSHRCAFCSSSHFWQMWRARSPENIILEMKEILKKYPKTKSFLFYDDNFTLDKNRVKKLCNLIIKEGLDKYRWNCSARADQVDLETLKLMKKAGLSKINYGVETGSPKVAKNIDKHLNLDTLKKTIKMTKKLGIEVLAFFMIGNPGETKKTIQQSIALAKELKPTTTLWSIAQILPGTKLAKLQPISNFIEYIYEPEVNHPYQQTWSYIPVFENKNLNREQVKLYHKNIVKYFTFYHIFHNPKIQFKHFLYSPLNGLKYFYRVLKNSLY